VNPFGFNRGAATFWFPSLIYKIHCGLFVIVFALILRIWVKASCKATKSPQLKLLPFLVYPCILLMAVISLYSGIMWYTTVATNAHEYSMMTVMVLCGIGYIFFGKNIVGILRRSGNRSPDSETLSKKIIVFVAGYIIMGFTSHITQLVGTLGEVFGTLFFFFVNGAAFLTIFLVLFFHPLEKNKNRDRTRTSSVVTPPPTPRSTTEISWIKSLKQKLCKETSASAIDLIPVET